MADYGEFKRMVLALMVALALHGTLIAGLGFNRFPTPAPPDQPSLNISFLARAGGEPPEELLAEDVDRVGAIPSKAGNIVPSASGQSELIPTASDSLPLEPPLQQNEPVIQSPEPASTAPMELESAPLAPAAAPLVSIPAPSNSIQAETSKPTALIPPTEAAPIQKPESQQTKATPPLPDESSKVSSSLPAVEPVEPELPLPSATELLTSGLQIARTKSSPRAQASIARERFYEPSSMTTLEEFYIQAWTRKVERVGTLNFPEEARRLKLTGKLILDVALSTDGSVKNIKLVRSSGHEIIDKAAVGIVKLAAPYAPFPPELARQYDILHIRRTWQFLQGNRLLGK
jgi:protein TonB